MDDDQPSTSQQNNSTAQKFGLKFGNKILVLRVADKKGKEFKNFYKTTF
jgi:hypothetical protein